MFIDVMVWLLGVCVLMSLLFISRWFLLGQKKKKKDTEKKGKIPEGNSGWPLVGETLDFIACGYTSKPVSFMEKRESL